jgi:signal transduction histidine kinase
MQLPYTRGVLYTISAIAVGMLIALLVGWNLILVENYLLQEEDPRFRWIILSIGCLGFVILCVTILGLTRYLVRTDERQRFQQTLLDSVSHELKTPLASMKLLMETLQLRRLDEAKEGELKTMIGEELERLSHLIDHMLEAGRAGSRKRMFAIRPVEIRAVVAQAVELLRRRWGPSFDLTLELDRCPDRFPTDAPALEIIVFNLLDNAVKYSEGRPQIRLAVESDWDWLHVTVTDQGIGLDHKHLRRVFGRFFRVNAKTPREHRQGVGLGLFVVRELLRRLGGRVWAESRGPGLGSTFHLRLPAGNLVESREWNEGVARSDELARASETARL